MSMLESVAIGAGPVRSAARGGPGAAEAPSAASPRRRSFAGGTGPLSREATFGRTDRDVGDSSATSWQAFSSSSAALCIKWGPAFPWAFWSMTLLGLLRWSTAPPGCGRHTSRSASLITAVIRSTVFSSIILPFALIAVSAWHSADPQESAFTLVALLPATVAYVGGIKLVSDNLVHGSFARLRRSHEGSSMLWALFRVYTVIVIGVIAFLLLFDWFVARRSVLEVSWLALIVSFTFPIRAGLEWGSGFCVSAAAMTLWFDSRNLARAVASPASQMTVEEAVSAFDHIVRRVHCTTRAAGSFVELYSGALLIYTLSFLTRVLYVADQWVAADWNDVNYILSVLLNIILMFGAIAAANARVKDAARVLSAQHVVKRLKQASGATVAVGEGRDGTSIEAERWHPHPSMPSTDPIDTVESAVEGMITQVLLLQSYDAIGVCVAGVTMTWGKLAVLGYAGSAVTLWLASSFERKARP